MIAELVKNTRVFNEYDLENQKYWFDMKRQKYLHNIDTYYYSVNITFDELDFNRFCMHLRADKNTAKLSDVKCSSLDSKYIVNGYTFGFYNYDLELKDEYLILVAENVPNESTPHILVQLRSYFLWLYGADAALKRSLANLEELLAPFNIEITKVISNRIDYCWHTNYIQDTEQFFNPKNVAKMRVSKLVEFDMHGKFIGDEGVEHDYLRLGRLSSNNLIFRAYLKSKEVVEMGYKPWFLKIWLFHGLINRYDFYCYEECFKRHSWEYLNKARLKYYHVYGSDSTIKQKISTILDGTCTLAYDELQKFSDEITPKVTLIINFEFQTKRRFMSSIQFINYRNRSGSYKDVFIELDHRRLIIDYLTHDTLRFVEKNSDSNKSRREYAPFWKRLRECKIVDSVVPPESIELVRKYNTNLNSELMKQQAGRAIATYNVYQGNNTGTIYDDFLSLMENLNDNDMYNIRKHKSKKQMLLKNTVPINNFDRNIVFALLNRETGEYYNADE